MFAKLKADFSELNSKRARKKTADGASKSPKTIFEFLNDRQSEYFKHSRRSLHYDPATKAESDSAYLDLDAQGVRTDKILNFKWVSAKRSVSNKEADKSLSALSLKIYQKLEKATGEADIIEDFKDALTETDSSLDGIYETLFQEATGDVKTFGGMKQDETIIRIISTLQKSNLLEKNTTVVYGFGE